MSRKLRGAPSSRANRCVGWSGLGSRNRHCVPFGLQGFVAQSQRLSLHLCELLLHKNLMVRNLLCDGGLFGSAQFVEVLQLGRGMAVIIQRLLHHCHKNSPQDFLPLTDVSYLTSHAVPRSYNEARCTQYKIVGSWQQFSVVCPESARYSIEAIICSTFHLDMKKHIRLKPLLEGSNAALVIVSIAFLSVLSQG